MTNLSPNAEKLLKQRYYRDGEDWQGIVERVTEAVVGEESKAFRDKIYKQIFDRVWLPNSPCLVNAGRNIGGLVACFSVGPDEDSLEAHFETLKDIAMVAKRGGGCGFSGTNIRHKGAIVGGSSHEDGRGIAYGPVWFGSTVERALNGITQGGFRSMALMFTLNAEHRDIEEFIRMKQGTSEYELTGFNQSVFASDAWLEKAFSTSRTHEAKMLKLIVESAWNNGEPGLLFESKINQGPYSTCDCPDIITTNPCSEQPLPSFGACVLGSINIAHDVFYDNDGNFRWQEFKDVIRDVTRFLDDVGDVNVFPNEKFKSWYENHRPIGVGVMGFADALLRLAITYGSDESVKFASKIAETLTSVANNESRILGEERGIPEHCKAVGRRNITTTTIAPTGSIATIADCSHGIEPIFAPSYTRIDERGETYIYEHPLRNQPYFRCSVSDNEDLVPSAIDQIRIQAGMQGFINSGISKTVNLPHKATVDEVMEIVKLAWKSGLKGITVYRNGSREKQVLNINGLTEDDALQSSCISGVCEL